MEPTVFVDAVKNEFSRRCRKNPRYSLRSFAKSLKVDQSLLSKVLSGKRPATASFVGQVAGELGLQNARGDGDYGRLTEDYINVVGDWFHFAILEYFKTERASSSAEIIAKAFDLHPVQVDLALQRLEKLGFLTREKRRYQLAKPNNTWFSSVNTSKARKRLQKQLHEKALLSLDTHDFAERDHSSLTVAIRAELLPEIREKITALRRELDQFIEAKLRASDTSPETVYQMTIAFFPLTEKDSR